MKRRPTQEQQNCVDLALNGGSLKIEALSGTGKTTVLEEISRSIDGHGLFLSHGKKIADEASKRFGSDSKCQCATFNSLAFTMMGGAYSGKLGGRISGAVIAQAGQLKGFKVRNNLLLPPSLLGYEVLKGVENFCQSSSREFSKEHFESIGLKGLSLEESEDIKSVLLDSARRVYEQMADVLNPLPCLHGVYVKEFVLKERDLGFDYFLIDEAQDSDPLMIDFLKSQRGTQMIFAGDRNQSINEWRGAKNVMKRLKTENTAFLTQSFRFGEKIAARANIILERLGSEVLLKGNPQIKSWIGEVEKPDAILCRTNSECTSAYFSLSEEASKTATASGLVQANSFISNMNSLTKGGQSFGEYSLFKTKNELRNYAYSEQGRDLYLYMDLIEKHGCDYLLRKIEQSKVNDGNEKCGLKITTAHRAKGLEFDHVSVRGSFVDSSDTDVQDFEQEANLHYVALTRAKIGLEERISTNDRRLKHDESNISLNG